MVNQTWQCVGKAAAAGCMIALMAATGEAQQRPAGTTGAVAATFQPDTDTAPPSWGTTATSTLVIPAYAAEVEPGGVWGSVAGARYISNGLFAVFAPFHLPTGTLVTDVQVVGCDSSATQEISFGMIGVSSNGTFTYSSGLAATGAAPIPGCSVFTLTLGTPHTIDNSLSYYVSINLGNTSATRMIAARGRYRLQVSPAPGMATFADVPVGNPIHPFVEALAAAGITGGCGGGNFCPNAPLTRGQMAVFRAVALGLHWPN